MNFNKSKNIRLIITYFLNNIILAGFVYNTFVLFKFNINIDWCLYPPNLRNFMHARQE